MYEWLKALHVVLAVLWVGGGFAGQVMVSRLRSSDPVTMVKAALQLEWIGTHIFLPASLLMLGAGLWMVFGFEIWELTDAWVLIGLFGFLATVITGAAFLGPQTKKIHALIEERGIEDTAVQQQMARLFVISRVDLAVLIIVVIDMVVKPTF